MGGEAVKEIGRRLRAQREALGISLETAEEETKIRRKYLEALEAGRTADIPGEAYLKGFLRSYANFLGLDGQALVEEYKQRLETQRSSGDRERAVRTPGSDQAIRTPSPDQAVRAPQRDEVQAEVGTHVQAAAADLTVPRSPVREPRRSASRPAGRPGRPKRKHGRARSRGTGLAVLLLLALVVVTGWYLFRPETAPHQPSGQGVPGQSSGTAPSTGGNTGATGGNTPTGSTGESTPAGSTGGANPAAGDARQPGTPAYTMTRGTGDDVIFTVAQKPVQVRLDSGDKRLWFHATVDGKEWEETFTGVREFTGTDLKIRVGHLTGVRLEINGQPVTELQGGGPYNLIFRAR
jgi:cytoskeleton protein RodZ